MGDTNSWTIFLLALFVAALSGIAVIVVLIAGFVLFLRSRSSKNTPPLVKATELGESPPERLSPEHVAYNVVSDTIAGLNVRKSDNRFQAIFISIAVVLSTALGAVLALLNGEWELPWIGGAIIGAFAGLLVGFFTSGIYLMVYRAVQHIQGKHK